MTKLVTSLLYNCLHVVNPQREIAFYEKLGMNLFSTMESDHQTLYLLHYKRNKRFSIEFVETKPSCL